MKQGVPQLKFRKMFLHQAQSLLSLFFKVRNLESCSEYNDFQKDPKEQKLAKFQFQGKALYESEEN